MKIVDLQKKIQYLLKSLIHKLQMNLLELPQSMKLLLQLIKIHFNHFKIAMMSNKYMKKIFLILKFNCLNQKSSIWINFKMNIFTKFSINKYKKKKI